MDKYIGRLLDNRYEILEVIGTGGMAVVYKARCHRLNRLVAIKILKNDYLGDEDFRRRFRAESQAVAMLSHPNIVSVYDVSTSVSLEADYIVMELIEGITLKQYMEKKGVLNWKEALHFASQIAKALEHAHSRGIVHRDIKPHNVMVLKNGSVKVTDFGIARLMSKGDTLTKEALGSVHYISPEQAKGGRVDDRSDIYSLGVVMYEMMAGRPPYEGESPVSVAIQHINGGAVRPTTLNPNIPAGMEQIIMKAMARELNDRYASATQMLTDMEEFRKNSALLFDYNTPVVMDIPVPDHRASNTGAAPQSPADRMAERSNARRTARQQAAAAAAASAAEAARKQQIQRHNREREESRSSRVATAAIIVCSLVALIAIGTFLFIVLNGGISTGTDLVAVPNLIGKHYDTLKAYPGLKIQVEKEVYDETYAAGQIVDQNPSGDSQVVSGTTVKITVSLGKPQQVTLMGDLEKMEQSKAENILDGYSLNLDVEIAEEYHDTIPAGYVIRTDPVAETQLSTGQKVTLYVSKGVATKTITMPQLVTQKLDTVTNLLLTYGFPEPDVVYVYSPEDVGIVVGQSVVKGTKVDVDTVIKLQVSKGPEPTEPETTEPDTTPVTVTKNVTIDLQGTATDNAAFVLVKRDGGEVFNQEVAAGTSSITIAGEKGSGIVEYQVYINDQQHVWTERVKFS